MLDKIVTIPYLPILGPVHPGEINSDLLRQIIDSSQKNILLPFDKSTRWYDEPQEHIFDKGIISNPQTLSIKTLTKQGHRTYLYGPLPDLHTKGVVFTFSQKPRALKLNESCSVIFLDEYSHINNLQVDNHIVMAHEVSRDVVDQICTIGDPASRSGLEMMLNSNLIFDKDSPTFLYIRDQRVLGVIGPLTILGDSRGVKRVLPCYFAVHSSARRQGVGTALWGAVRDWGYAHHAEYKILQAEYNSPAESFYRHQGLGCLGYVYKQSPGVY